MDSEKKVSTEMSENKKERKRLKKEKSLENKRKKLTEREKEPDESAKNGIEKNKEISTLSIALPGSILENAQSKQLRTYLAGQIARAACSYQVDEIVVFDDHGDEELSADDSCGLKSVRHCCGQLARILQYLECPQYLRKHFFPKHKDLEYIGLINPLNAPHHLSSKDHFHFREGVVTSKPITPSEGSLVYIGLRQDAHVDKCLDEGVRCTVKLHPETSDCKKLSGIVVHPGVPRKETGIYWGYKVRLAKSLSEVFSQCPYKDGYDFTIGTSDKGSSIDSFECPSYKHALLLFGGVKGLEFAVENDQILRETDPELIFDSYLNILSNQGTKTIRTEEAILITLASLRPKWNPMVPPISFEQNNSEVIGASSNECIDDAGDLSRFE